MDIVYTRLRDDEIPGPEDTSQIQVLLEELRSAPTPITSHNVHATVSSAHSFFVARQEGSIVGMVVLYVLIAPHKKYGHLELCVVDPQYRGRGVGRQLLRHVIADARNAGVHEVQLTTNATKLARVSAFELYKRMGFTVPATTLMRLTLTH